MAKPLKQLLTFLKTIMNEHLFFSNISIACKEV